MRRHSSNSSVLGFTLIELLVVIALVTLLFLALVPAHARIRQSGAAAQCLSNTKRLVTAWQMYAEDNQDRLVIVLHGGGARGGAGDPIYGMGWVEGWLDWTMQGDNTNSHYLVDPRFAKIAPYVNQATNLFKCPADNFLSSVQVAAGWAQRARSYSLQVGVGAGNAEAGPWDALYKHVYKTSDLGIPSPGETILFLDEHPDSIADPAFFPPHRTLWVDIPATFQNGGCGFGFADGHSDIHRWNDSLTSARARQVGVTGTITINSAAGDADIHWMSFHTPRNNTNSY